MPAGKIITINKKARFDYDIQETYEAGIALQGSEVKSLREGRVNLKDSYAALDNGEIYLYNCHISPYNHATGDLAHEPLRRRKLLLHKREIRKLIGKIVEKGLTLIPLKVYFGSSGKVKVELALAKGKRVYDKREDMKKRDAEREMERAFRARNR